MIKCLFVVYETRFYTCLLYFPIFSVAVVDLQIKIKLASANIKSNTLFQDVEKSRTNGLLSANISVICEIFIKDSTICFVCG